MKKLMLCSSIALLAACSTPPQQSSVPMDMQAVAAYQHRVATGKTIDKNNPTNNEALNQSDRRSKEVRIQSVPAMVMAGVVIILVCVLDIGMKIKK